MFPSIRLGCYRAHAIAASCEKSLHEDLKSIYIKLFAVTIHTFCLFTDSGLCTKFRYCSDETRKNWYDLAGIATAWCGTLTAENDYDSLRDRRHSVTPMESAM